MQTLMEPRALPNARGGMGRVGKGQRKRRSLVLCLLTARVGSSLMTTSLRVRHVARGRSSNPWRPHGTPPGRPKTHELLLLPGSAESAGCGAQLSVAGALGRQGGCHAAFVAAARLM